MSVKVGMTFLCPLRMVRVFSQILQMILFSSATTLLIGVTAWNLPSQRVYVAIPYQQVYSRDIVTATKARTPQSLPLPSLGLHRVILRSSADPNKPNNPDDNEEDEGCMSGNSDEEECEIDWSTMPGFIEEDVEASLRQTETSEENDDYDELRILLERQFQIKVTDEEVATSKLPKPSADFQDKPLSESSTMHSDWKRLEMMWQQREAAAECDVYEPITCGGHVCPTCSGSGSSICRFCRGTKFLYLPITNDEVFDGENTKVPRPSNQPYVSCSICHASGVEICRSCQGSGWIADWTQMGVRAGGMNTMPPPPPPSTRFE